MKPRAAAAVFLIALTLRLVHVWQIRHSPFFDVLMGDAHSYDEWAKRIAGGEWIGHDVFYQAPLYPYFLGVIYALAGPNLLVVRLVQAFIGATSCVLLAFAVNGFFSREHEKRDHGVHGTETRDGVSRQQTGDENSQPRGGSYAGLIAGLALAIYAPAIFFDGLIQKSVLDTLFITLTLWLIGRLLDAPHRRGVWLGLGATLGGLSLTRENALVFVVVIGAWCLLPWTFAAAERTDVAAPADDRSRRAKPSRFTTESTEPNRLNASVSSVTSVVKKQKAGNARATAVAVARGASLSTRAAMAAMLVAGLALVLLPVAIRNAAVGGGFFLTTSQLGPNFYIGNNPKADGTYMSLRFGRGAPEYERQDATELAEKAAGHPLTPSEVSSYWTDRALAFIRTYPGEWLRLEWRKVMLLVNRNEMLDTESQESYAEYSFPLRALGWFGHFGLLLPLAVAGAIVAWPERRRLAIVYALTLGYAASVVAFYVFARYRLPLVPLLITFAAPALATLTQRFFNHEGHEVHTKEMDLRDRRVLRDWKLVGVVAIAVVVSNWPLLSPIQMQAITETNLATALQDSGRANDAIEHYQRAIALRPDYAPAYNNLGVAERAAGRTSDAIGSYRQALALKSDYADAHYNLANALLDANKPNEAAEHFRIALAEMPDAARASNNLGIALSTQGKGEAAVDAFRAAVAADPSSAIAHRNLGDALSEIGHSDEAVTELRRAIALNPRDPGAHYNLGNVYLEAQRFDLAIAEFRATLQLTPDSAEAHNNLGIALGSTGDLDGSIAEFERALVIKPGFPDATRNLAMSREAQRRARQ